MTTLHFFSQSVDMHSAKLAGVVFLTLFEHGCTRLLF